MPSISEALAIAVQHYQAGRLQSVEQICRQILAVDPDQVDATNLLGVIAYQLGNFESAIELFGRAIALKGNEASFHGNLGNALKMRGRLDEAVDCFRRGLKLKPDSAELHNNLGSVFQNQKRWDEAAACFRRALELKPDYALALYNLGTTFQSQQKLDEAIDCFRRGLEIRPDHAEAYNNLGTALHDQGQLTEAAAAYRRALEFKPDLAVVHNNLGNVLQALRDPQQAANCYQRALELNPNNAEAHSNLANAWKQLGRFGDALASYDRALELRADYAAAHCGRAMLRLLLADFESGWREYEWRWKTRQALRREFPQPRWNGDSLGEKTILLHDEQGFGDTIQFIRYVSLVKSQNPAATLVLECQPPLTKVLATCPGIDQLIARGNELPPFDCHAPLLSLPAVFNTTTVHTVPANVPYLSADSALVAHWRERLAAFRGLRIGINWHGRPGTGDFSKRNLPLRSFASLAATTGVCLISLQKGEGREQLLAARESDLPIVDLGDDFDTVHGPFMDTAAVMMNLDLVITSDTSVPHLAGALGVPVWLALPSVPDWRWLLDRRDSPWYPTMRLFRQKVAGDWSDVFAEMLGEIRKLLASNQ